MALILNIDTATEIAIVSISDNESVLASSVNSNQKDQASFLQPAIQQLLKFTEIGIGKLDAVAVAAGPGSYTGLRVGMASVKGLSYALNIPLIGVNSLEIIAASTIDKEKNTEALYCPMIDARRMEVFTAVYKYDLKKVLEPCSMILDNNSFKDLLVVDTTYFSGSGAAKLKEILSNKNALFIKYDSSPQAMAALSYKKFVNKDFVNIATSAPIYIKEFQSITPPSKV